MKIGRHRRGFSVIFVPPGGGRPRSFNFSRRQVVLLIIAAGLLLALLIVSLTVLGRMGRFSAAIARLKRENTKLIEEKQKLVLLEGEVGRLREIEGKLAALLGAQKKNIDPKLGLSQAGLLNQGSSQQRVAFGSAPSLWPVQGEISQGFSLEANGHKGIDIAVERETPVKAAGGGMVEFAGQDEVFGNMIIVNHGSGISTLYGHNSSLVVSRGQSIRKGQTIAYSGNSGNSSAPHLHFEVSRNGRQVDPLSYLKEH